VGFIGGPRFGVGLAFGVGGGVGWFPLGFGEPFVPWYHTGFGYFSAVNVTNTRITNVNITNVYNNPGRVADLRFANQGVAGAVTAVPKDAFVAGHSVGAVGVAVPHSALQGATVVRTAGVAPVKESVLGGHTPLANGVPPARAFSRPVVTHAAPPPRPVSFEAKQPLLANTNGMPLDHNTVNNLRQQGGNARYVPRPPDRTNAVTNSQVGPAANAGGNANRVVPTTNTNTGNAPGNTRYVPRPPQNGSPSSPGTPANVAPPTNTQGQVNPNPGSSHPAGPSNNTVRPAPPPSNPEHHATPQGHGNEGKTEGPR
jgi:hypothetical protein